MVEGARDDGGAVVWNGRLRRGVDGAGGGWRGGVVKGDEGDEERKGWGFCGMGCEGLKVGLEGFKGGGGGGGGGGEVFGLLTRMENAFLLTGSIEELVIVGSGGRGVGGEVELFVLG